MKRLQLTLVLSIGITFGAFAQQPDQVAIRINGTPIYKSEVERAYLKGNEQKEASDQTTFDQFIDGFVNYKLNVAEARAMRMDTMQSFKRDYSSYRIMLTDSYLKNPQIKENVLNFYHTRLQENLELNYAFVPFDKKHYLPSDTLQLYNKALAIRQNILKTGFKGKGYTDNSKTTSMVIDKDNRNGYLGWVMAFTLQPTVEDTAYSLPLNKISMPIRSSKGYHIVQVLNRRPSAGLIDIEQITFGFNHIPPTQQQIDSVGNVAKKIHAKLIKEKNFDDLCTAYLKVSESQAKDCSFGIQALNADMPPAFTNAAFDLKNIGDISQPVMTDYGYHIIRLKNKYPEPPLDKVRNSLEDNIMNTDRLVYYTNTWRTWQALKYGLKMNPKATNMLYAIANTYNPQDSNFVKQIQSPNETLFTIDNKKEYKIADFEKHLLKFIPTANQKNDNSPFINNSNGIPNGLSTDLLEKMLSDFSSRSISHYADSTLEEKQTQFRQIMNEYADGLLFFEIKNTEVWNKSKDDEKGLIAYFDKHKANYKWQLPKYKGTIILSKNKPSLELAKRLIKANKNNIDFMSIASQINVDSTLVKIESGLWAEGENKYADTKLNGKKVEPDPQFPLYEIKGKKTTKPEEINDIRLEVTMDYQNSLNSSWTNYLLKKYTVEKDQSVLKSIEK